MEAQKNKQPPETGLASPPKKRRRGRPPGTRNVKKRMLLQQETAYPPQPGNIHPMPPMPVVESNGGEFAATPFVPSGYNGYYYQPLAVTQMQYYAQNSVEYGSNMRSGADHPILTVQTKPGPNPRGNNYDSTNPATSTGKGENYLTNGNTNEANSDLMKQLSDLLEAYRQGHMNSDIVLREICDRLNDFPELRSSLTYSSFPEWEAKMRKKLCEEPTASSALLSSTDGSSSYALIPLNATLHEQHGNIRDKGCHVSNIGQVWSNHTENPKQDSSALQVVKPRSHVRKTPPGVSNLVSSSNTLLEVKDHALNLYKILESRYGKNSDTYNVILTTLSKWFEMKQHGDSIHAHQHSNSLQLFEKDSELRNRVLKLDSDLYECFQSFFNDNLASENNALPLPIEYVVSSHINPDNSKVIDPIPDRKQAEKTEIIQIDTSDDSSETSSAEESCESFRDKVVPLVPAKEKHDLVDRLIHRLSFGSVYMKNATVPEKLYQALCLKTFRSQWMEVLVNHTVDLVTEAPWREYIWKEHRTVLFKKTEENGGNGDAENQAGENKNDDDDDDNWDPDDPDRKVEGVYEPIASELPEMYASGRTGVCSEALNSSYSLSTHRSKFALDVRTKQEEMFDSSEDSRYEIDIMLHHLAFVKESYEDIEHKMSKLTNAELKSYKLDENDSTLSYRTRNVAKLYFETDGEVVLEGLKHCPNVFVPVLVKVLSRLEKYMLEIRNKWNLQVTNLLEKKKGKLKWPRNSNAPKR